MTPFLITFLNSHQEQEVGYSVSKSNSYLRGGPSNETYATGVISKGDTVLVLEPIDSLWVKIEYDNTTGYGKFWLAVVPIVFFVFIVFASLIKNAYEGELRNRHKGTSLRLVGFNINFNRRVLQRIYNSLIQYEYLDEDLNQFEHFHNVLVFDFDEHESVLHFHCTQSELKYILEKFKPFKKGLHLSTFERSGKIYNKGELISAKNLSKNYNKHPLTKETEDLIDSFFNFLGDN